MRPSHFFRHRKSWFRTLGAQDRGWYVSVSIILFGAVLAKLYALASDSPILRVADPIFGMPMRNTAALAIAVEIVAMLQMGRYVLTGRAFHARVVGLLLALVFLGYRIIIHALGYSVCPCLGGALSSLGLDGEFESQLMLASVIYILISSAIGMGGWNLPDGCVTAPIGGRAAR
jgi:hypothetical protein